MQESEPRITAILNTLHDYQVEFIIVYGLDFNLETKALTPFGNLVDNVTVTHIEIRVHAAHRRSRNQFRNHIARVW